MANQKTQAPDAGGAPVYSETARMFHWTIAVLVLIMVPLGLAMSYRGNTLNVWDGTTDAMYSTHKLIGFIILWLMIARLAYRVRNGAPPDEPTLEPWQKAAAHATHWALYALLIAVPIGGWLGVSLYGSRDIFGIVNLPPIAPENQDLAVLELKLHKFGGWLIGLLVAGHIGVALYHHLVRKDGVLRRMLPGLGRAE